MSPANLTQITQWMSHNCLCCPTGIAEHLRALAGTHKPCSQQMNWAELNTSSSDHVYSDGSSARTELNWPAASWPSYTTRSLVTTCKAKTDSAQLVRAPLGFRYSGLKFSLVWRFDWRRWRQPRRGCRGHIPPNILVGGGASTGISSVSPIKSLQSYLLPYLLLLVFHHPLTLSL